MTKNCEQEYSYLLASLFKSHFEKPLWEATAQKMKFSIKDFFSKCDQIGRKLWIWSHLLNKSLMKDYIFCAVSVWIISCMNIRFVNNRLPISCHSSCSTKYKTMSFDTLTGFDILFFFKSWTVTGLLIRF